MVQDKANQLFIPFKLGGYETNQWQICDSGNLQAAERERETVLTDYQSWCIKQPSNGSKAPAKATHNRI